MKSVYYPDREDILEWTQGDLEWPAQDWEAYVMDSKCDDLIMEFANLKNPKDVGEDYLRRFFTYVLYFFVGNYYKFNRNYQPSKDRLSNLLELVDEDSSELLKDWKIATENLLKGNMKFDYDFWMRNKILYNN